MHYYRSKDLEMQLLDSKEEIVQLKKNHQVRDAYKSFRINSNKQNSKLPVIGI